jgi:uncharacterized membrane protein YciS (DUF1049 family)
VSAWDAAWIFFVGVILGWLLATVGYGRALQRVAKLYREMVESQLRNISSRLAALESVDDERRRKLLQTRVIRGP